MTPDELAAGTTSGFEPQRKGRSAHPSLVPFQAFPTADRWIVVACAKEKFFPWLAAVLGRSELAEDPRFVGFTERLANHDALQAVLDEIFVQRGADKWLSLLRSAGVPCGPVNSVAEALTDPQIAARDMVVTTEHPHFGTVSQVASPVRVGAQPSSYSRGPRRHENADELLRGLLGYDDAAVYDLGAAGAFGPEEGNA